MFAPEFLGCSSSDCTSGCLAHLSLSQAMVDSFPVQDSGRKRDSQSSSRTRSHKALDGSNGVLEDHRVEPRAQTQA